MWGKISQYVRAVQDFTKAIDIEPTNATHYVNRGAAYLSIDETELAMADFSKGIDLDPSSSDSFNNRAICWSDMGNEQKATEDYTGHIA
ncbi:MAG: tetratricopeptide repeat protein [Bacteroidetes bacterium]|nr:tetratricopeptide repeat protein [Bacteroidota bacterium]